MIELSLIGIGTGNPRHLTLQAIDAMRSADLILIPLKGAQKDDLAGLRRRICADHCAPDCQVIEFPLPVRDASHADYRQGVDDWHDAIAQAWLGQIRQYLPEGGKLAFLIWGDPSLYDSTLRIAERLTAHLPLQTQVIPGITAIQALCAAHAIPLNTIGAPVHVTTGRNLRDHGWPAESDSVVVMLDGSCSFQTLPPKDLYIWWGGFVGMPEQILLKGPLAEIGSRIIETRAQARAAHGWIMDIYLLRRV
ncbi:precorrin-6A synthase (deacetylating) [Paracoccus seriniphilus]|uniref:Precorrin-6A synthase [deacetylating] n=1 Tax=Paracoccus seriniphilus TaxID=184748 RepID=A0A239PME6_9RHOB|nr:precorrin-6A synthase (deacetylating) [Paracoccus seriniphilus]WCR13832.1 precorrin-6A synthase (deacetylating) [Paracoccus seriniphilus]SNT68549.1 precorrin-6A synthase (deacetylating) [Paracoccus seriniphilus]